MEKEKKQNENEGEYTFTPITSDEQYLKRKRAYLTILSESLIFWNSLNTNLTSSEVIKKLGFDSEEEVNPEKEDVEAHVERGKIFKKILPYLEGKNSYTTQ